MKAHTESIHSVQGANSLSLSYQAITQVARPEVVMDLVPSAGSLNTLGPTLVPTLSSHTAPNKPTGKSKKKAMSNHPGKVAEPLGVLMPDLLGLPVKEWPTHHRVSTLTCWQEAGDRWAPKVLLSKYHADLLVGQNSGKLCTATLQVNLVPLRD